MAVVKHFTTRWRNSSIYKKLIVSLTILSLQSCLLFLCFCLSVCLSLSFLSTQWWSIITTLRLHQHPSLFMEFRSQGHRGKKLRERKRQPSSQGHREGYSALYFQMTSQIERMCPCPHIFNCQSLVLTRHLLSETFTLRVSVWSALLSLYLNKIHFHKCIVPKICDLYFWTKPPQSHTESYWVISSRHKDVNMSANIWGGRCYCARNERIA